MPKQIKKDAAEYIVLADAYVAGARRTKGSTLWLTPQAAKYETNIAPKVPSEAPGTLESKTARAKK